MSKNGNLLLNVPPRADGSFDPRVVSILEDVGDWLAQCGQAIYGTRPWVQCCESDQPPVAIETLWPIYSTTEYRFTTNKNALFVIAFGWESSRLIRSLNLTAPASKAITDVSIVGSAAPVQWECRSDGMSLVLPADKPPELKHHAWVLRMQLDGAAVETVDGPTAQIRARILGS